MKLILLTVVFVFHITLYSCKEEQQYVESDELGVDREAKFYCYKLKSCTPGGPKVCGFDEFKPWLVEFEDICVMYKTNCNHKGRFHVVDQIVCDTRNKYDKEHPNETFEVIHINPTSVYHPVLKSAGASTPKRLPVKLLKAK